MSSNVRELTNVAITLAILKIVTILQDKKNSEDWLHNNVKALNTTIQMVKNP